MNIVEIWRHSVWICLLIAMILKAVSPFYMIIDIFCEIYFVILHALDDMLQAGIASLIDR